MDRRTFVLLTGAGSATLVRPPFTALHRPPPTGRRGAAGVGRLRFELDDRRRWSLWYYGADRPAPVIQDALVGIWVGNQLVTLVDLEDSTVGNRRPPGGEAVVVRGRVAGVFVEAEFLSAGEAAAPQAAVTVTIYPDRYLPTVKGVRFFQASDVGMLPGDGPLLALLNGYHSSSPCRLALVSPSGSTPELVSHGALGLGRGGRGLALAFDPGEPGESTVKVSGGVLDAVSDWLPARPLRPEGDTSRMRLCYEPGGQGLDALTALFVPSSPMDRERLASAVPPAGWCSRYELSGTVSEADVIANLEFCAANFDRRFFRYIQLDDGYQRATGDWETNDKFPHGHRWLTDQIRSAGLRAGLWVAPFAVTERSGIPTAHPDWLVKRADGPIVWDTREDWGGRVYALDGAHPQVQQWLFDLARRVVSEWGYDCLKIDFLDWATAGDSHYGGLTHAEAYRKGLAAIRDGLGTEAFLHGAGAPLQHAVGYVNGMRIGADVDATWGGLHAPARAAALRSFYHRASWLNDPGCLVVRPPLSVEEAQVWASVVALSGGVTLFSDNLPKLPPERVALLQRVLPAAPVPGHPVGPEVPDRDVAPAIVVGDEIYGPGGLWSTRRDQPPARWVLEGAPGWWTVALVNWDDEPQPVSVPLAALGITGAGFHAYDVWRDAPRADLKDVLSATLDRHSTLAVGIRAAAARPQVIGTTRHVVQGAVDIVDEKWEAATRTLSAKSVNLTKLPYAVTIAVPQGMRPGACTADVRCTVKRLESGHAVLEWAAGGDGRDIRWQVSFRSATTSRKRNR